MWPSTLCSHRKSGCRVSSGRCAMQRHQVRGPWGGHPSNFLGEKLVTVRDMKEQSKAHETSCLD